MGANYESRYWTEFVQGGSHHSNSLKRKGTQSDQQDMIRMGKLQEMQVYLDSIVEFKFGLM